MAETEKESRVTKLRKAAEQALKLMQEGFTMDGQYLLSAALSEPDETEHLRQRVKELEKINAIHAEANSIIRRDNDTLKSELAALKADDTLTVAYMSGFYDGKKAAAPKPEEKTE